MSADRITIDPDICHGKPCIRGLRYPVENLLELLAGGMSIEQVLGPKSLGEFQSWFRTDADCLDYLEWLRWSCGWMPPQNRYMPLWWRTW